MDSIEAFRHLGIDEKRHRSILARTAFSKGFGTGRAFLDYLRSLGAERDQIEELYDQLRGMVRGALQDADRTQFTASQLKMLDANLSAASTEYGKRNERLMLSGLRSLTRAGR